MANATRVSSRETAGSEFEWVVPCLMRGLCELVEGLPAEFPGLAPSEGNSKEAEELLLGEVDVEDGELGAEHPKSVMSRETASNEMNFECVTG